MNFQVGEFVNVNMTSLCGYVETSYDALVATFGEPTFLGSGDDKVDFEWDIQFDDGTVATVYNWKDYDGGWKAMLASEYCWHIGGRNQIAVSNVLEALGEDNV